MVVFLELYFCFIYKNKKDRKKASICWSIPQMSRSQALHPGVPNGDQVHKPRSATLPGTLARSLQDSGQPGHDPHSESEFRQQKQCLIHSTIISMLPLDIL